MKQLFLTLFASAGLVLIGAAVLPAAAQADDRRFDRGYNQSQQDRFNYARDREAYRNYNRLRDRRAYLQGYRDAQRNNIGNRPNTITVITRQTPYDYSVYSGSNTIVHSYPNNQGSYSAGAYPYGFRQPLPGQSFYTYR